MRRSKELGKGVGGKTRKEPVKKVSKKRRKKLKRKTAWKVDRDYETVFTKKITMT